MSYFEFTINVAAIITFAWLTYKLLLIAFSLPINLARVNRITLKLSQVNNALTAKPGSNLSLNSLLESLRDNAFKSNECPINMLQKFAKLWKNQQADIANARAEAWFANVGRTYQRHYSLASYALDWGILYTVCATLNSFAHIGSSADPFSAFASLATAALTTAGGLGIKLATTFLLDKFERRMESLEKVAETTMFYMAEVATSRDKKTIPSHPNSDRWKTSPDRHSTYANGQRFLDEPNHHEQSFYRHTVDRLLEVRDIGRRPADHQNGKV